MDLLFQFQDSAKLTKEDIERVFALYDRVSDFVSPDTAFQRLK